MNVTLYDYQYDLAAIVVTLVLINIFMLRSGYMGRSNGIFLTVIFFDLIAATLDAISCYTISYPQSVPLWVNYVVSLGYLLFYNSLSVLYFLYIDSKGQIPGMRTPVKVVSHAMIVFYILAIGTSPWTHMVAYFDDNLVYSHGPLMAVVWVLPFTLFVWELVIFYQARNKFSTYQVISSIAIIFGAALSVVISFINPRMLVGPFFMAVIMFFIYVCYENPAHYTYLDTQCLNNRAFNEFIAKCQSRKKKYDLIGVNVLGYDKTCEELSFNTVNRLNIHIADVLYQRYKKRVFCVGDGKFVILSFTRETTNVDETDVKILMGKGFEVGDEEYRFEVATCVIDDINDSFSASDVSAIANYLVTHNERGWNAASLMQHIHAETSRDQNILDAVKKAIKEDTLQVYFQPIYHPQSGKFRSAEALIRLVDPELGYINPEELIVISEKNGLINQVGDIVFEKVCRFIGENKLDSLGVEYIEVNLSPLQCRRAGLVQIYTGIMKQYNVSPYQLNFEITETAQLTDEKKTMQNIVDLFVKGIGFSIDDYGSGFASADYLIKLPVSLIKIDKTILWSAMKSTQAMIVLKNTIAMAKELGKSIVVEGVETEDMAQVLLGYGVDYNQGFLYSKPIPGDQYIEFLVQRQSA